MADQTLSKIAGGAGSISQFPQLPVPLKGDGHVRAAGSIVPHNGTLINNVGISFTFNPTAATASYTGYLGDSTIWTVDATDIDGAADGFTAAGSACWYDSINDRLYVFALDVHTIPDTIYTSYITLETGAITLVGNAQLSVDTTTDATAFGACGVGRAAIDSGNFILRFADRTVVLNESTGAEVSNIAEANTSEQQFITLVGSYITLDGTMQLRVIYNSGNNVNQVILTRNGNTTFVPIPLDNLIHTHTVLAAHAIAWGDKVKIMDTTTNGGQAMLKTFLREEFDEWLQLVADYGGIA